MSPAAREAERMILEGRVSVNGQKIDSPALDVTPSDKIRVDGKPLDEPQEPGSGSITSRSGW